MDAFEGCDYDLLDVMDLWGCCGMPPGYHHDTAADSERPGEAGSAAGSD